MYQGSTRPRHWLHGSNGCFGATSAGVWRNRSAQWLVCRSKHVCPELLDEARPLLVTEWLKRSLQLSYLSRTFGRCRVRGQMPHGLVPMKLRVCASRVGSNGCAEELDKCQPSPKQHMHNLGECQIGMLSESRFLSWKALRYLLLVERPQYVRRQLYRPCCRPAQRRWAWLLGRHLGWSLHSRACAGLLMLKGRWRPTWTGRLLLLQVRLQTRTWSSLGTEQELVPMVRSADRWP